MIWAFNCFLNFESLQNDFKAWNPFFVQMLHPKMNSFDHCWADSSKVKDVDFPLATELMHPDHNFLQLWNSKIFRKKSFGEEIQNIMKHIDTYPFGGMKIFSDSKLRKDKINIEKHQ